MEIISSFTLIFLVSSLVILLFSKFDHPSIPAYLVSGILIAGILELETMMAQNPLSGFLGSSGLQQETLLNFAQIGIAFLVFTFGLKFDPKRLKKEGSTSLGPTSVQLLVVGSLGFLVANTFGFTSFESAVIATSAALSSSLIGLQLADREIQNDLLHGRLSESIHLIQDIFGLIIITVIFSTSLETSVQSLGATILVLSTALLIREYGFDIIAEQADYSRELMMLAGLTSLIGAVTITTYLGLPMVIGSFAAGLTAAKFPHNMELLDTLGPLKDFFSAIFFVSLGALVTLPDSRTLLLATSLIILSSLVKPGVIYHSLKFKGLDPRTSMLSALSLDQISEISLIIAIQAFTTGLISEQVFHAVVLSGTVSMLISSYTKRHEEKIYQLLKPDRKVGEKINLEDHIIVVGYDIQGLRIVDNLLEEEARVAVIENNPEKISTLEERGIPAVYGDIMDMETWIEANYTESRLIVSTVPSKRVSEKILELDRPEDKIMRAENPEEASILLDKGALHVTVPDIASSELLIDHIEGVMHNENYREELRRKSLLEVREYLESQ